MRLTLRTLLAYLDDVLEPSQIREIGQKVRESPVAAALVSRIRESMRRRRLGAPDLEGPGLGLDPNLVAAYLDNTLPPNRVVDLEQICLESDVLLAEVASCHQILTLVVAEGREVPQANLDRYYALGPVPFDDRLQVEGGTAVRTNGAPSIGAVIVHPVPAATPSTAAKPWSQQVAPLAGIALILAVAIMLLVPDRNLFQGLVQTGAVKPGDKATDVAAPDDSASTPDVAASPAPVKDAEGSVPVPSAAPASPETVSAVSALPAGLDPAPPPDAPETVSPASPAASATPATAAATTPPAPGAAVPTPPVPATEPPPTRVRVPIHYNSSEGVLVRYEPSDGHWYVHPRRGEVHPEEIFACPEPFEAQFDFDQGAFKVTLLSDSSLDILPGTETARQGIHLRRGRVVLQPGAARGTEPRTFVVQTGAQRWWLQFSGLEAACGLEVQLREPVGIDRPWDGDGYHAAIYVPVGTVQIQGESGEPETLSAGQRRVLSGAPWPAGSSAALPLWLDPQRRQTGETLRTIAARFEKEFDPTLAVDLTIPALTKDPHFRLAQLAARSLSVMESYRALTQTLAQSEHEEARAAAAQGLRLWLGQSREAGPLLRRELASLYPADEADVVYRLLWNFTPEDAKDKIASQQLVDWLSSSRVEIRELAFHQLMQLTGRQYSYRALGTPSQRASAVQRWQAHLQREGALVKGEE